MSDLTRTMFYFFLQVQRYRIMFHKIDIEQSTRTMFYNNVLEDFSRRMY